MSRNWNKKLAKSGDQMKNKMKNEDLGVSRTESGIKKPLEITYKRATIGIAQHLTKNIDYSLLF